MKLLNTKIQHKNFEPGEFVEEKKRTYEEALDVIKNFPWEKERDHIAIGLTNPSVTIEADPNNFLKFALFYNGKFVLHYFNWHRELYTKSFYTKEAAFPYIQKFYESEFFDLSDFKKEPTIFQHNLQHFVSQDFHYTITRQSIKNYLLGTSGINFAFSIFLILGFIFSKDHLQLHLTVIPFILFAAYFIGGGINLTLFFNYYHFSKNKIVIMSKGNPVFYYGDINNPLKYDKKDVVRVTQYRGSGSRNPVNAFAYMKIEFRNSPPIQISNLLVNRFSLKDKLYECTQEDNPCFPWMTKL